MSSKKTKKINAKTVNKTASKKATKKVAKKATKKVAKKATKKVAKKATKKVAKKVTKKVAKKVAKKTTKKVAKKTNMAAAKKVTKKITKKASKKVAKKVTKKAATKVTKKVSKKIAKKVTKKITKKTEVKNTKKKALQAKNKTNKKAPAKMVTPKNATPAQRSKGQVTPQVMLSEKPKKKSAKADKKNSSKATTKKKKTEAETSIIKVVPDNVDNNDNLIEQATTKPEKSNKKLPFSQIKELLAEEILELSEDFTLQDIFDSLKQIDFFKSDSNECLEKGCDNPDTTSGYCRFHYIKNWSDIKKKQAIMSEGKLQIFIEELLKKFPVKVLDNVIGDLIDDKSFFNILKDLNIESCLDGYEESVEESGDDNDIAYETKGAGHKTIYDEE